MQMIHPLHAGGVPALPLKAAPALDMRAVASKARARRQVLLRTFVLLAGSALLICGLLMWRTDSQRLRISQDTLDGPVGQLQNRIDQLGGVLPASLAVSTDSLQYFSGFYDRTYAQRADHPAIVAASARVSLLLRPSGRFVVMFDHGRLHTRWMSSSEYDAAIASQYEDMRAFEEQTRKRPPEFP